MVRSEADACRELHLAGRELACDTGQRCTKRGRRSAIPIRSVETDEVCMVQHIEGLRPKVELHGLVKERKGATDEWVNGVDTPPTPRVATDYGAVDDWPIRRGAGIAAVGGASDEVIGKTARERTDATNIDLEGCDVDSAHDQTMTLIIDSRTVFDVLGKVRVIRVLTGGVGIYIVQCMRPGVTE